MTPLFQELRFYLTRTLSPEDKAELKQLIEQNGGVVSATPACATQLVDCETLDARHPEWISMDFVKDSVSFQSLQDPSQYSGNIFTIDQRNRNVKSRGRMKYTVEDDARMLHFAKLRGWKSMQPIAESAWKQAESDRVTLHSSQSMYEHFRKQLQRKTPIEQRSIMSKAAMEARARLKQEAAVNEREEAEEMKSYPNSIGIRNVATPESTTSTQASRQTSISADRQGSATIPKASLVESRGEEKSSRRDLRTRSRKPTSPLRISQRFQRSEGTESSGGITSPQPTVASSNRSPPATLVVPATPELSASQATPACSEAKDLSAGRKQQKRKRRTSSSGAAASHDSSPSCQDTEDSDADGVERKTSRNNGVYFCSTWTELARDPAKRRMLQRFFEPPSAPAPEAQPSSSSGSAVTYPIDVVVSTAAQVGEETQQVKTVEHVTDEETDQILCQLQLDTHQDMAALVHAVYYCSGDVEMAKTFLTGAMPSSMWSSEDDFMLVNLVAEERIDRSAVDAAVARGDFASMRVPRDTDAILERVQFLR